MRRPRMIHGCSFELLALMRIPLRRPAESLPEIDASVVDETLDRLAAACYLYRLEPATKCLPEVWRPAAAASAICFRYLTVAIPLEVQ